MFLKKGGTMSDTYKKLLIQLLADGHTPEQCVEILKQEPYLIQENLIKESLRDPVLLAKAIEKSNDIISQAWGTMWKNIKLKASLGSVQHSKLLIEFIQNKNRLPDNKLHILFDEVTSDNEESNEE